MIRRQERLIYQIGQTFVSFNKFYNDTKILSEEDENKKSSWLTLINLVKDVLEQSLDLLGINSVEKM